jgi:hypothetical protein
LESLKLSGRRFSPLFALLLLLGVALGIAISFRFRLMLQGLEQLRNTWPSAAAALEDRYRDADEAFQKDSNLSSLKSRWSELRIEFQQSGRYDQQARFVRELEHLRQQAINLGMKPKSKEWEFWSREDITRFSEAESNYAKSQAGGLGTISKNIFRLDVPERITDSNREDR